jgi:hypothetical protein
MPDPATPSTETATPTPQQPRRCRSPFASYLPARRATRVDPIESLKAG